MTSGSQLSQAKEPKRILILSYGYSGSIWLAQTLHKLPFVYCTVGTDHPLIGINYWHNKPEFERMIELVKQGYFQQYGCTPHLAKKFGLDIPNRCPSYRDFLLEESLDLSNHFKADRQYIMNVHGLDVRSYLNSRYFQQKDIQIYDLIRHPIPMTESCLKGLALLYDTYPAARIEIDERIQATTEQRAYYTKEFGVDFSDLLTIFTFFACQRMEEVAWSLSAFACPRLKFEELNSNPAYFTQCYKSLFQSLPNQEYLDFVYSPENLTSGRQSLELAGKLPLAPKEQFEAWTAEQRKVFKVMLRPELKQIYQPYQYDLSFI